MSAYTLLQLFEVLVAGGILVAGVLARSPSITLLGGGFLIGKAVLNILAPEGGTVYRRSLIGYTLGAVFVVAGSVIVHFAN
ncbi:hypothetical protein EPN29_02965 [bacterium]|nr:MAG: hypothetical protein EPN29_02965 [bacterium]